MPRPHTGQRKRRMRPLLKKPTLNPDVLSWYRHISNHIEVGRERCRRAIHAAHRRQQVAARETVEMRGVVRWFRVCMTDRMKYERKKNKHRKDHTSRSSYFPSVTASDVNVQIRTVTVLPCGRACILLLRPTRMKLSASTLRGIANRTRLRQVAQLSQRA